MSSAVAVRSAPMTTTTSRSASLCRQNRTNRDHDLRDNRSANHQIDADRASKGCETTSIAGILYKWVNLGQGWKRRWFVLQDGVLSYYNIHDSHNTSLTGESFRRSTVIDGQSLKIISRNHKFGDVNSVGKPLGQIHLKVASINQSRSDAKRFSIFTGTKRLHLKAATTEDRTAWLESLQAVKAMFPRMSNTELMAPAENLSVSTDRLRRRLMQESVNHRAVEDCEKIMRNEFAALKNQLVTLKQKHCRLMDTLKVRTRKHNKLQQQQQQRSRNVP